MKLAAVLLAVLATTLSFAQGTPLPPFAGTWALDLHRSTIEANTQVPPDVKVDIQYDGTHWHRGRSFKNADGTLNTRGMDLVVDAPDPAMSKSGSFTVYSEIHREGGGLVFSQQIISQDGQRGTNTVTYSLEDHGNTLVEVEHEVTPVGTHTNRWVSTRLNSDSNRGSR